MTTTQTELLNYAVTVELEKPAYGFWDGGAKSHFEFTPEVERTPGVPAIRWGSYSANLWIVVPAGNSVKRHLAAVRRKLAGKQPRTISVKRTEPSPASERRTADHVDGYDRDDTGESPDF